MPRVRSYPRLIRLGELKSRTTFTSPALNKSWHPRDEGTWIYSEPASNRVLIEIETGGKFYGYEFEKTPQLKEEDYIEAAKQYSVDGEPKGLSPNELRELADLTFIIDVVDVFSTNDLLRREMLENRATEQDMEWIGEEVDNKRIEWRKMKRERGD